MSAYTNMWLCLSPSLSHFSLSLSLFLSLSLSLSVFLSLSHTHIHPSCRAEQKRKEGLTLHHTISSWQHGFCVLCVLGTKTAQLVSVTSCSNSSSEAVIPPHPHPHNYYYAMCGCGLQSQIDRAHLVITVHCCLCSMQLDLSGATLHSGLVESHLVSVGHR